MSEHYYIKPRKDSDNRYGIYFELTSLWDPATGPFPLVALERITKALNKLSLGCKYGEDFIRNLENIAAAYEHNYGKNK